MVNSFKSNYHNFCNALTTGKNISLKIRIAFKPIISIKIKKIIKWKYKSERNTIKGKITYLYIFHPWKEIFNDVVSEYLKIILLLFLLADELPQYITPICLNFRSIWYLMIVD
jgi:hypothetical protein